MMNWMLTFCRACPRSTKRASSLCARSITALAAILICGASVFTSCINDIDDNPVTPDNPDSPELADYAILLYGNGGGNLDDAIVENIQQFYAANPASFDKVKIAVQYKFSTEKDMNKLMEELQSEGALGAFEYMQEWLKVWKDRLGKTYRFTVDASKKAEEQLGAENLYASTDCHIAHADSLTHFINWAVKACPAKHYVLILTNHGTGYTPDDDLPYTPAAATRGLIYDAGTVNEDGDTEHLTLHSLNYAIASSDIRPQVVYFDACLMNSLEYWFELKNSCDYVIASSFLVPGIGGDYTALTDLLANCHEDIESALRGFDMACVERWNESEKEEERKYFDMSVIRTSGLNAYGNKIRTFTDKLLEAYQSGDEAQKRIDLVTSYALKILSSDPYYDMLCYAMTLAAAVPDFLKTPYNEMQQCYDNECIVAHQTSDYLSTEGITGSVMLGWEGQYECLSWYEDDNNTLKILFETIYKPDGTAIAIDIKDEEIPPYKFDWGSTFADSYEQTAFDKATGWSRWIWTNKQRPATMSAFSKDYKPLYPSN